MELSNIFPLIRGKNIRLGTQRKDVKRKLIIAIIQQYFQYTNYNIYVNLRDLKLDIENVFYNTWPNLNSDINTLIICDHNAHQVKMYCKNINTKFIINIPRFKCEDIVFNYLISYIPDNNYTKFRQQQKLNPPGKHKFLYRCMLYNYNNKKYIKFSLLNRIVEVKPRKKKIYQQSRYVIDI